MNASEILNQVRVALGMEEQPVKLATEKLANGTTVEAETFEPGAEISIVADGEKVPVPAGEYEMENGQMLIVSEDGIIGEIKEAEAEEEQPEVEVEVEAEAEKPISRMEFEELKKVVMGIAEMIQASKVEPEPKPAEVEQPAEAEKVEMTAIKHSPEKKAEKKQSVILSKRKMTTIDRVLKTIAEL